MNEIYNVVPQEGYWKIFLRFLQFGLLAWGGPVAQIALIKQELVEKEKWISPQKFNHILSVYQVLPGPEAHELCCYFGYLQKGRLGSIAAGLGFMLPGFLLVLLLAWVYINFGNNAFLLAAFAAVQPVVAALVVRATHRLGKHAIKNFSLGVIGIVSLVLHLTGVPFLFSLIAGGISYYLWEAGKKNAAIVCLVLIIGLGFALPFVFLRSNEIKSEASEPTVLKVGYSGLKAGLLTFGGAYTAVPFLRRDTVEKNHWITEEQFLDSIAISSLVPSPLIIFATFIGYLVAGFLGALIITLGIFAPAFSFTLIGHNYLEAIIANKSIRAFLDGVTASVIGLIAGTAISIVFEGVKTLPAVLLFSVALLILFRFSSKLVIPTLIVSAALIGLILF